MEFLHTLSMRSLEKMPVISHVHASSCCGARKRPEGMEIEVVKDDGELVGDILLNCEFWKTRQVAEGKKMLTSPAKLSIMPTVLRPSEVCPNIFIMY